MTGAVRRERRRAPMMTALVFGLTLGLSAVACTGGTTDDDEAIADTTQSSLTDESISENEIDDSDPDGPVTGPTLDGSASTGDVTDVWTLVDDDDFVPDADRSVFSDMEGDPDGRLVIAGSTIDHQARSFRATMWHSDDEGSTLTRVELPTLLDGVESDISDVEFVPTGSSVAVDHGITQVVSGSVGSGSGQRAAVWIFRNNEWTQVESDTFAVERREWTHRLSVGADGELLILGSTTADDGETTPVAWSSSDGETWNRSSESFDVLPDTTLADAALGDAGVVVIGHFLDDSLTHSQVYVSSDGVQWEHSVPPSFVGEGNVWVQSVVTGPGGVFVAVGSIADSDGVRRPASWTSDDGLAWNGPSTSFGLNDDGRSISSGFGVERVRHAEGRYLAIATADFLQHVWASDDGLIWNPVGNIWDAEPDGVNLAGVTAFGGTTVTISDGRVYHGSNGRWRRLPTSPDIVPQPSTIPWANDATADGDGFAVVGGIEEADGALLGRAWTSTDGVDWTMVEERSAARGAFEPGPYRNVVAGQGGYLVAAPESLTSAGRRSRFALSYLHPFSVDGPGLPSVYQDDTARVILSAIATLDDLVTMAGVTFDGTTIAPVMVEGTLTGTIFEPTEPSTGDGQEPVELIPASVATPNEADREAWGSLCSSPETMVAVLDLDDTSSTAFRFYTRTIETGWELAESGPELGAAEDRNWVNACEYGSDGFLAVGGGRTGSDSNGVFWRSDDGTAWEKVDVPTALVDPATDAWPVDLATHGDDYLVIGNVPVDGASLGYLWIGSPSAGWTEVPAANNPVGFDVGSVAVNDAGTVVVAGWRDGQMTVVSASLEDLRTGVAE